MEKDPNKKIIGISCDNYKIEKFKELLHKEGFQVQKEISLKNLTKGNQSLLQIQVDKNIYQQAINKINVICICVENYFKSRN